MGFIIIRRKMQKNRTNAGRIGGISAQTQENSAPWAEEMIYVGQRKRPKAGGMPENYSEICRVNALNEVQNTIKSCSKKNTRKIQEN